MHRWLLWSALMLGAASCGPKAPVQGADAYAVAVEASVSARHARAAQAAWAYLQAADPDDPRYERGERLYAQSLEALGFSWAAALTYQEIASERRTLELLPDALRGLQRVMDSGAYDEDLLVTGFLASESFGYVPPDVQSFLDYQRALDLVRRGSNTWAEDLLKGLREQDAWHGQVVLLDAVRAIAAGDDDRAAEQLTALLDTDLPPKVDQDVRRTLARLAFAYRDFDGALERYLDLRERAPDDPALLLELAWTYYYLGDARKTLGMLVALDAPVHAHWVAPERYILEALALQRLCQFDAARAAADRFQERNGAALSALRSGALPHEVPKIAEPASLRGLSEPHTRFVSQLSAERALAAQLPLGPELRDHLDAVYARSLDRAQRQAAKRLQVDARRYAEELLAADEGVRLVVHELGVSLLRGRRRPPGPEEAPPADVSATSDRVVFRFGGEYWTDELDDLVVSLEDRCID